MELRPYRLAVRTPGSHPGNPGSIPGGVTRLFREYRPFGSFYMANYVIELMMI